MAAGVLALAMSGATAAPAPPSGVAASVDVAGHTVLLWRDRLSGEIAVQRLGDASLGRILGTTMRQTDGGGESTHLIVDDFPSRGVLFRIVRMRFGPSRAAIEAALARGRPAPPPAAVVASRRDAPRARSVDINRHFGANVRALAAAARTDVAWMGSRSLGLALREASLLSSRSPPSGSSGALAFVVYSDNGVDPGAEGARTLSVQSAPATSLGGGRLAAYLRGRGPNPRLGGAVARRITRGDVVLRIGPAVALVTLPRPLTDPQLRTLLTQVRLVHPGG
jgi:hypothetical protein